jgi:hypothetical protein
MRLDEDHTAAVARGAWIGSAGRQAALPGPLRELHRAILRRFLQTADPPAAGWIDGQILDQDAAVERGRRNFGPLLGGSV